VRKDEEEEREVLHSDGSSESGGSESEDNGNGGELHFDCWWLVEVVGLKSVFVK
jgi:hypothetical protein